LVLDRPTPAMVQLCEELNAENKSKPITLRVDVLKGVFGGPGPARNAGLTHVDSRYVAFWDSDDHPNIPLIIKYLTINKLQHPKLVVGSFEVVREGREKQIFQTNNLHQLAKNPGLWRCLIPFEFVEKIKFPEILLGEDQVFLAKVIARSPQVEYTESVFYSYVYGKSDQLTANKDFSDLLKAETLIAKIFIKNANKEEREFIYNLSTKQLLTMFLRGQLSIKIIASVRMIKKLILNFNRFSISLNQMLSNPSKDRFNA
jgi:glycosyltransferase involved in cell wall biosynthesis